MNRCSHLTANHATSNILHLGNSKHTHLPLVNELVTPGFGTSWPFGVRIENHKEDVGVTLTLMT